MGIGASIVMIAVGAILRFAVTVTATGFNLHTIGLILMIAGIAGLVMSLFFWGSWGGFGRPGGYRRQRSVIPDGAGGYVEDERVDR